jgi:hypothetical protein
MIGGTAGATKMGAEDAEKIERLIGRPAEELNERELQAAMRGLGIEELEITEEDQAAMDRAEAERARQAAAGDA